MISRCLARFSGHLLRIFQVMFKRHVRCFTAADALDWLCSHALRVFAAREYPDDPLAVLAGGGAEASRLHALAQAASRLLASRLLDTMVRAGMNSLRLLNTDRSG